MKGTERQKGGIFIHLGFLFENVLKMSKYFIFMYEQISVYQLRILCYLLPWGSTAV